MVLKDSTTTDRDAAVHAYWLETVMDDRAEFAGPPPLPAPADTTDEEAQYEDQH